MEVIAVFLGILVLALIVGGPILGIIAIVRTLTLKRSVDRLFAEIRALRESLVRPQAPPAGVPPAREFAPATAPPPPAATPAPPVYAAPVMPQKPFAAPPLPPRPEQASWADFEKKVGTRWIAYAGAVALFFASAFFVKYAFDNGWIGPTARVVAGIIFGVALLIAGDVLIRRKMQPLGSTLIGGGLAILYLSLFAGYKWYSLIPQPAAFASMVVVTAAGMALAVLHNAAVISVLAILGGFLTPVLLSTGVDARDALFTYILVLNLGVLAVSVFRKWRGLESLSFAGTVFLYTGWYDEFYKKESLLPALYWLGAFYAVFLILPFIYHFRTKTAVTLERFLLALANAAFAFTLAYGMLYKDYESALGFVAAAMSIAYLLLGALTRKRISSDAQALFGFVALAVLFLTLAIPLELGLNGILIAWAAEGPVLVLLGYTFRYRPVRVGGFIILIIAFLRLFALNWPEHTAVFTLLWNAKFGAALSVPLGAAALALIHKARTSNRSPWDIPPQIASAILGGLLAVLLVSSELSLWFQFRADETWASRDYLPECSFVIVWALGALAFLGGSHLTRSRCASLAGLLALVVSSIAGLLLYREQMVAAYLLALNFRFAVCLIAVAVAFIYAWFTALMAQSSWTGWRPVSIALYSIAAFGLLVFLSLEPYSYCVWAIENHMKANWASQMSLSVVWSVYAAAALGLGFWKRIRPLRFAALALFALTAVKVVTIDMAGLRQIYRIISFFGLGLLMIGASYLYHRVEKRIAGFFGEK